MGYLYGVRFKAAEDPLILALREVGIQGCLLKRWFLTILFIKGIIHQALLYHRLAGPEKQCLRSGPPLTPQQAFRSHRNYPWGV
jgi:hypothetical protein